MQLLEENLGSTFGNLSVAPAPRDILWQNMKSPAYLWSYILFFATILIAISCIALSPAIFAKNIQEKVFDILPNSIDAAKERNKISTAKDNIPKALS